MKKYAELFCVDSGLQPPPTLFVPAEPIARGIASSDITKLKSADFGKAISDEKVLIHLKMQK